jgi:hypothetical protein
MVDNTNHTKLLTAVYQGTDLKRQDTTLLPNTRKPNKEKMPSHTYKPTKHTLHQYKTRKNPKERHQYKGHTYTQLQHPDKHKKTFSIHLVLMI